MHKKDKGLAQVVVQVHCLGSMEGVLQQVGRSRVRRGVDNKHMEDDSPRRGGPSMRTMTSEEMRGRILMPLTCHSLVWGDDVSLITL